MRKSPSSCRGGPSASVSTRRTGCACEAPPSWCSSASSPARRLEVEAPVQRQRLRRRPGQAGQRRLAGRDERHVAGVCGGDALGSEGRLAAVERELDHEMVLRLVDVEIEARAEVARIRQMDAGLAKTRRGDALRWRGVRWRWAVVRSEIPPRNVRAHEIVPEAEVGRESLARVTRSGAVPVQVTAQDEHELLLLRERLVEEYGAGQRSLVGEALDDAQCLGLVRARERNGEDRVLGEVDALVQVAAFLAADDVEVGEQGDGWIPARVQAGRHVRQRRAGLHALVYAAPETELLVQKPPAELEPGGPGARIHGRGEAAQHVRVRVDGRLVRAAGDGEAGVRIEDQSALEQQDVVALGAERTPCNPGVLDDHATGVVAKLSEVRVVDLEVIGKVAAYVAVHLKAGPAHEEIVAGVGSVRAPVLVDLHLGLDEDLEVERRVFRR